MIKKRPFIYPDPLHFTHYGKIEYIEEDFLESLYNDCTVAIVGPSNQMIGSGLGEYIDSFDTVIRLNRSIPVNPELKDDIGTKVDVLYHALTGLATYSGNVEHMSIDAYKSANLKALVITSRLTRKRRNNLRVYYDENYNKFRADRLCYEERIPTRNITTFIGKLRNKMGTGPNTGIIATEHVLTYPVKKLFLCGFDFYDTFYYGGYGGVNNKPRKKSSINKHHDIDIHREYTAGLYNDNDHVEIDEVMKNIFKREGLI